MFSRIIFDIFKSKWAMPRLNIILFLLFNKW